MNDADEIFNVVGIAEYLNMGVQQIYQMTCKRGQERHKPPLPFFKLGGKTVFRKSAIAKWISESAAKKK